LVAFVVVGVLEPGDASVFAGSPHRIRAAQRRPCRAFFPLYFGRVKPQLRPLSPPGCCRVLSDTWHGGAQ
jgi:hypothetical protein